MLVPQDGQVRKFLGPLERLAYMIADDPFAAVQTMTKAHLAHAVPDVAEQPLLERVLAVIERQYGPLEHRPLTGYDIRQRCRFCHGYGCLNCDVLCQAEYKRQFPHGPQLIARFDLSNPEEEELARTLIRAVTGERTHKGVLRMIARKDNAP